MHSSATFGDTMFSSTKHSNYFYCFHYATGVNIHNKIKLSKLKYSFFNSSGNSQVSCSRCYLWKAASTLEQLSYMYSVSWSHAYVYHNVQSTITCVIDQHSPRQSLRYFLRNWDTLNYCD